MLKNEECVLEDEIKEISVDLWEIDSFVSVLSTACTNSHDPAEMSDVANSLAVLSAKCKKMKSDLDDYIDRLRDYEFIAK